MTDEQILKVVRQNNITLGHLSEQQILAFAHAIAAAEREEAAKVCDELQNHPTDEIQVSTIWTHICYAEPEDCAAAIRARGETK